MNYFVKNDSSAKNPLISSWFTTTLFLVVVIFVLFNFNSDVFKAGAQPISVIGDGQLGFIPKWVTPSPFDYTLSNSGTSSVTKSSSDVFINNTITKTLTLGSGQPVDITATGMPSGVSVAYDANRTCSPNCTSVIGFTITPSAPAGDHTITVTGSPFNETTQFTLSIIGSSFSVTCSANPLTASLGQNVTWTATVTGGTAPYTYSWSGNGVPTPAPTTASFNTSYSTVGTKSASVTVTSFDSVVAICSPAATTQINFNPGFEEF